MQTQPPPITIPPAWQWLQEFAADCTYVTLETHVADAARTVLAPAYPPGFTAFSEVFNGADVDGVHILSAQNLLTLRNDDAAAADIAPDLLPFARDANSADFFCFNPKGQVQRWLHDGGARKILYPDFSAFLLTRALHISGALEAFERPAVVDEKAAGQKADLWETRLRQQLADAGANMEDPWHPSWESWKGIPIS